MSSIKQQMEIQALTARMEALEAKVKELSERKTLSLPKKGK